LSRYSGFVRTLDYLLNFVGAILQKLPRGSGGTHD
jgi:hypothetical protein